MIKSKTITLILISFICIQNKLYLETIPTIQMETNDPQLDVLSAYSSTLSYLPDTLVAKKQLKHAVTILDSKNIKTIKSHPNYTSLGDIYMYAAFKLEKEIDKDEMIRLLERARIIRKDPTSLYKLATLYKEKYDEALKDNNEYKEVEYGKKVYIYLSEYINIQPKKEKAYKNIIAYFKIYSS